LSTLGANLGGAALTTGNIFLRRCLNDQVAVADGTATHIKINIAGAAIVRRGAAGKSGPATAEIVIRPRKGANPILNFDLASAIS
ncbi:MAG TPA: hypothetical protein PK280_21550, partial [Planctomycetota bacterium]|nr:hypothetical protein [Planctomycetota bacterium]